MVAFSGPVSAGPIESPKLPTDEVQTRQAAIDVVKARLAEAGTVPGDETLEAMPTDTLVAMAEASTSTLYAGRHYHHHRALYWATVGRVLARIRPGIVAIAVGAGLVAVVLQAIDVSAGASALVRALTIASFLTSAAMLGGACTAMILGHFMLGALFNGSCSNLVKSRGRRVEVEAVDRA